MKKEIMEKWVEALRSGDYKQGQLMLNTGKFCCLGVLCDISDVHQWEGSSYGGKSASLSKEVLEYTGMKEGLGWYDYDYPSLSQLNDVKGMSFHEIADVIERDWEKL